MPKKLSYLQIKRSICKSSLPICKIPYPLAVSPKRKPSSIKEAGFPHTILKGTAKKGRQQQMAGGLFASYKILFAESASLFAGPIHLLAD
ncbi:hypothetical protein [Cytobacillus firmus]|uniref:hypothetical protein n=1 Tax=Cytobacillus firmus TaxID=1399 RepID=UPI0021C60FDE|nr:hypothetical protein [Cytobacillus firmus]